MHVKVPASQSFNSLDVSDYTEQHTATKQATATVPHQCARRSTGVVVASPTDCRSFHRLRFTALTSRRGRENGQVSRHFPVKTTPNATTGSSDARGSGETTTTKHAGGGWSTTTTTRYRRFANRALHASWAGPLGPTAQGRRRAPLAVTAFTGRSKETASKNGAWLGAGVVDDVSLALPLLSVASILLRTAGPNGPPSGPHRPPCWRNGLYLFSLCGYV